MSDDPHRELYDRLQQVYVLLDDGDRRALRSVGLTPTHFTLLRLLDPARETGRTITRLAELMLCTRGNATRLVQRLTEAGLVTTGSDRGDQRLVQVYLTDAGADRLAAASVYHAAANRLRFAGLPEADLRQLTELAGVLAEQLGKHLEGLQRLHPPALTSPAAGPPGPAARPQRRPQCSGDPA